MQSGGSGDAPHGGDHLFTTFEGGFILCRTMGQTSAMAAQLRVFRQLVEALLHHDRPS